jgi:ubiquinone/menaquinone biosynthesis C-methylase UbiE
MAHMLGERARIGSGDHVLDVGFGFGDQDMYWMETSRPKRITGLNITGFQVDRARQRVEQKGLHDRIDLREGSATAIPFPGEHFDKIMALECAFHFDSREDFFGEAFRVMKTGGRLAVADIIPMDSPGWPRGHGLIARLIEPFRQGIWQMPTKNQYPGREYQKRLEAAGFENVSVTSIREHVFGPLRDKVRGIIRQPEMRKRLHPLYDNRLALAAYATFIAHGPPFAPMDYVIVTADRPASAPCDAVGVAGRVPV